MPARLPTRWIVETDTPVWAAAPGQAAVFYDGERCLGGGRIALAAGGLSARMRATVIIGPALVLAVIVGLFHVSAYVFIRGRAGARLPLLLIAAILGAWAGDTVGARMAIDPLRIGEFHLLSASFVAWLGIGLVAILAVLVPERRRSRRPTRDVATIASRARTLRRAERPGNGALPGRDAEPEPQAPPMIDRLLEAFSGVSFHRGLALGALVGAAIAGSTLWSRIRSARDARGESPTAVRSPPSRREPSATIPPMPSPVHGARSADRVEVRRPRSGRASSSSSPSAATPWCPSSSLVPAGDNTLLFVNSGMVPFKDALTGAEKRSYTRAVNFQRCLRVAGKHNDFEEVGRSPRHHTFFEMLGNWSFGDYFKREAIHWAWDFLTKDLGIPGERLAATVYTTDDVAHGVWKDEIGLPPERLVRWGDFPNGDEKNWWRMADIGPCGPCSEIHFDRGPQFSEGDYCVPDHSENCPRWLEIWNLVFMEFELHPDRSLTPLPAPGVDTGMGLERLASVVQQVPSNYDTDLFAAIHERMRELFGHDPDAFEAERFSYQVIADHSRAIDVPARRRRAALERGPRLRLPPDHPARGPPRPAARAQGAVPRRGGEGRHRHDGRLLPAPARERGTRSSAAITREEVAVQADARGRHDAARGGAHPADLGRARGRRARPRTCRPTRRSCRARSRSSSTTRSASRST